jgi:hypothetical protein
MQNPSPEVIDRRWGVFWLVFFAAICALSIAAAVESRSIGHAMSAASFAIFGVISYRWMPLPLTAQVSVFLRGRPMEPLHQVLSVIALLLLFGGLFVRWTIG